MFVNCCSGISRRRLQKESDRKIQYLELLSWPAQLLQKFCCEHCVCWLYASFSRDSVPMKLQVLKMVITFMYLTLVFHTPVLNSQNLPWFSVWPTDRVTGNAFTILAMHFRRSGNAMLKLNWCSEMPLSRIRPLDRNIAQHDPSYSHHMVSQTKLRSCHLNTTNKPGSTNAPYWKIYKATKPKK